MENQSGDGQLSEPREWGRKQSSPNLCVSRRSLRGERLPCNCLVHLILTGQIQEKSYRGDSAHTGSAMFVLGNLVLALAKVLDSFLSIYMVIIVVAALITWVNPDPYNPIVRFLRAVTEPAFGLVRRRLPLPPMGIDISPIIVLLVLLFLQIFLVSTLYDIGRTLR